MRISERERERGGYDEREKEREGGAGCERQPGSVRFPFVSEQ